MCSFIVTNKNINNIEEVNKYIKKRGQDHTGILQKNKFTFVHNLLSLTGNFTPQPLAQDDVVCVFNGEIYNFKEFGDYNCDSKCIIPLYKEYGLDFVKKIDGEYAIVLIDFREKLLAIITDIFSTKPIFIGTDGKIGISTYKNPLKTLGFKNIQKVRPNTIIQYNIEDFTNNSYNHHIWNLRQYKTNFEDWNIAFQNSIKKRTQNIGDRLFLGLSSGYDSGAIVCELLKQNIKFKTYTNTGSENMNVLNARLSKIKDKTVFTFNDEIKLKMQDYIRKNIEPFKYTIYSSSSNYNEFNLSIEDDNGTPKLAFICELAKNDGKKIFLSGQGSDEIFSDYGWNGNKIYAHSNFGGLFPNNLSSIFPWASFYGSSMETYLLKEEYINGSYNLEGRYVFLDKQVIQEFLSLDVNLKNAHYKSVLYNYLVKNNFPFGENQKFGF